MLLPDNRYSGRPRPPPGDVHSFGRSFREYSSARSLSASVPLQKPIERGLPFIPALARSIVLRVSKYFCLPPFFPLSFSFANRENRSQRRRKKIEKLPSLSLSLSASKNVFFQRGLPELTTVPFEPSISVSPASTASPSYLAGKNREKEHWGGSVFGNTGNCASPPVRIELYFWTRLRQLSYAKSSFLFSPSVRTARPKPRQATVR